MNHGNHIETRFASCLRIGIYHNEETDRDVQVFHMSGNFKEVGLDDGVECKIVSAVQVTFRSGKETHRHDFRSILLDIAGGRDIPGITSTKPRERVLRTSMKLAAAPTEPAPAAPRERVLRVRT